MSLDLNLNIDLQSDDVYRFFFNASQVEFTSPPGLPSENLYTRVGPPKLADSRDMPLFGDVKESYSVRENKTVVGSFSVIVTYEVTVTLAVYAHLLVRNDLSQQQRDSIVTAFAAYNPRSGVDPVQYAVDRLSAGITLDMFHVRPSFTLHKHALTPTPHPEHRDAILSQYRGGSKATIIDARGQQRPASQYFETRHLTIEKITEENVIGPSPTPDAIMDTVHQLKVANVNDSTPLRGIVTADAKGLGCEITGPVNKKIISLIGWPEFMIQWVDERVHIGCFDVVLRLPKLKTRITDISLYAYAGYPSGSQPDVLSQIGTCLTSAAFSGAVVGVALGNFLAAWAAFVAVFKACIVYTAVIDLACLVPGIALLQHSTDWS